MCTLMLSSQIVTHVQMDRESNSNKQSGNKQIHLKTIDNVNNTIKTCLTFGGGDRANIILFGIYKPNFKNHNISYNSFFDQYHFHF